jgi:hypothetical protein
MTGLVFDLYNLLLMLWWDINQRGLSSNYVVGELALAAELIYLIIIHTFFTVFTFIARLQYLLVVPAFPLPYEGSNSSGGLAHWLSNILS